LISDIQAVIDSLLGASDILLQYEKDSHKGVRRRFVFKDEKKVEYFDSAALSSQGRVSSTQALMPSGIKTGSSADSPYLPSVSSSIFMTSTRKIWFSGSFTYYLPQLAGLANNIDLYRKQSARIFGEGLTVEDIWQLAPWTWLLDWFFDVKSTISAHQRMQDDNLVMNYGYIMSETILSATQVTKVTRDPRLPAGVPNIVSSSVTNVRKERLRANPYGFGLKSPAGLNSRQGAILTALGLSRL